jgi:hypothetical protein
MLRSGCGSGARSAIASTATRAPSAGQRLAARQQLDQRQRAAARIGTARGVASRPSAEIVPT